MASLKELVGELKEKFSSSKYRNDLGLLKQRVKDQGKDLYYWMHTFEKLFIDSDSADTRDDILFYVKYDSKNKKEVVEPQRKDSKNLPNHSDLTVLWDQTVYLNLLLHEFEYHLTCCVLNRKEGDKPLSERMRTQVSMQLYPSTKERRMDLKKSKSSEDSYPNLLFYIDNYEQIFHQICLEYPGEKVAVQIVAVNSSLSIRRLIFMGGLDFTVLKDAVQQKEKENASFTISLLSRKKSYTEFQDDFFFIQMKGPDEKGFAQMAVRLTPSTKGDPEQNGDSRRDSTDPPSLVTPQSLQDSSTSSSDTVDIQDHDTVPTTTPQDKTPPNTVTHLVPPSSKLSASTSADSINSANSGDFLFPAASKQIPETKPSVKKKSIDEQDKGISKKNKKSFKLSKRTSKEIEYTVHAYLTYIQLPWHTIAEDILKGHRDPYF